MKIETDSQLQECIKAIEEAQAKGILQETVVDGAAWMPPRNNGMLLNGNYKYRLKPKPLECWAILGANRELDIVEECAANNIAAEWDVKYPSSAPHRVIVLREVVDE